MRGINICRADAGSVGACAHRGSTVIRNQTLGRSRTVDVRRSLREVKAEVRQRTATRPGYQIGHEDWVATVDLERVNLLPGDEFLDCRRFCLQLDGGRRHLYRLRH